MAILENLTINGEVTSETVAPRIGGLRPSLHWEFWAHGQPVNQVGVEIRISNSQTDWGSDSLVGNVYSNIVTMTSNSLDVASDAFVRGMQYYGQIRATDSNAANTVWSLFSFVINRLPVAFSAIISPQSPSSGENLVLDYSFYDADDDDETGTAIRWFKFNIPQPQYDDLSILPSTATAPGDTWHARIIPNDGIEFGVPAEASPVTVEYVALPFLQNVLIYPPQPTVDDLLRVDYEIHEDEYTAIFNGLITTEWYVNNVLVTDSEGEALASNTMRLDTAPGDVVYAVLKMYDGETFVGETTSNSVVIQDVRWHISKLMVSDLFNPSRIADTEPVIEWEIFKSTAAPEETPSYLQILVTRTRSKSAPLYDSGVQEYTSNSFVLPRGTLEIGRRYFVHVGAGDTNPLADEDFVSQGFSVSGSRWQASVNNATGWTIECKLRVTGTNAEPDDPDDPTTTPEPNLGFVIHDGTRTCSVQVFKSRIKFISTDVKVWEVPSGQLLFDQFRVLRISGLNTDVKIYVDNELCLDASGSFTRPSNQKFLEYGDIDNKWTNSGNIRFLRYATTGAFDLDESMPLRDTYLFYELGALSNGSIDWIHRNILVWTPTDETLSSRLIEFQDAVEQQDLYTTSMITSPVTAIAIDNQRRKYIGTANGVNVISGEKHDADYTLNTTADNFTILPADFDRISTIDSDNWDHVESAADGWFTIDTTHSAIGIRNITGEPLETTITLANALDDAKILTAVGNKLYVTGVTDIYVGHNGTDWYEPYAFRYIVSLPAGSQVVSAHLSFKLSNAAVGAAVPCKIYLVDTPNYYSFGDYVYAAPVSTEVDAVTWEIEDAGMGDTVTSADISALVQSFIDRPEYSPGYYMGLQIQADTGTEGIYRSLESTPLSGEYQSLTIEYADPSMLTDEYNPRIYSHGIHYFTQRAPGHAWFDNVDNAMGWQVTFAMSLAELEQDDFVEEYTYHQGFGVYVNDGTRQELIYVYPDRLRLFYANVYVPLSTGGSTAMSREYRIVGKGDNIKIFQRPLSAATGSDQLLLDGSGMFTTPSTLAGNSRHSRLAVDSDGVYHAVWDDDGSRFTQLLYSSFDGSSWSTPEIVATTNKFTIKNPDIDIDSLNRIWVAYEDTSFGPSEISVSVRDQYGWNKKIRITNYVSEKYRPAIRVDSNDDVHVVWEDNRNGIWEIMWAKWANDNQAFTSTNYFGTELPVMSISAAQDYRNLDFRNPRLSFAGTKLWLTCEGLDRENGYSLIYYGFYDLTTDQWSAENAPIFNASGAITGFAEGWIASDELRISQNPTIAASSQSNEVMIAWEDHTDSITQIWAIVLSASAGQVMLSQSVITARASHCTSPAAGWVGLTGVIAFQTGTDQSYIYQSVYNQPSATFVSSAYGANDQILYLPDGDGSNPALAEVSPDTTSFCITYDYLPHRDPAEVSSVEYAAFSRIGYSTQSVDSTTVSVVSTDLVSMWDTKEFAFGDFSENVGMRCSWKNFRMYFGYDAEPYSIARYNSALYADWPSDRINDIFVDFFGNIIAATYGGLVYFVARSGKVTNIETFVGKTVTCVDWAKNGVWFVGTTEGAYVTNNAGQTWTAITGLAAGKVVQCMDVTTDGNAVLGTTTGIFLVAPNGNTLSSTNNLPDNRIKVIAVDENNIVWAGTATGLVRLENYSYWIVYNTANGMKSSDITAITIVNKYLRYVGTHTGVERMYGTRFYNLNTKNTGLINDNITALQWNGETNSLWIGALNTLHEIVFRDAAHEIIADETVHYNSDELLTESETERKTFYLLDLQKLQYTLNLESISAQVFINKQPVTFGYSIDPGGQSLTFQCDLLPEDMVEVRSSNLFVEFYRFDQKDVEREALGLKRTTVSKLLSTSQSVENEPQYVALTNTDTHSIAIYDGESRLPYSTLLLDRQPPWGCLEFVETVTPTNLKFRIFADDDESGLDGFILSNYENFTSDGQTPLYFQPMQDTVVHNIGAGLTNVVDFYSFPSTVTIAGVTYPVGKGKSLANWVYNNNGELTEYLFVATSAPVVIFKYDPVANVWTAIQAIQPSDSTYRVNRLYSVNNVIYAITGSDDAGQDGAIYRCVDGQEFTRVRAIDSTQDVLCITDGPDGIVYFGTDNGSIYKTNGDQVVLAWSGFDSQVTAMAVAETTLFAATGNKGRVFRIDLTNGNNSIIFDSNETSYLDIHVKDRFLSPETIYLASGSTSTIYRAALADLDFLISYRSYPTSVPRLQTVDNFVLEQSSTEGTSVVAAIGPRLMKHTEYAWEIVHANSENINDFFEYETGGIAGLFLVSDSKLVKWTNVLSEKKVYLKVKDKAGNVSSEPEIPACATYAVNISDLKGFVNESRLVHINSNMVKTIAEGINIEESEYGEIIYTYSGANGSSFFAGDQIDEEVGVYTSEIFNGSNDLVAWKTIVWYGAVPTGTSIEMQIRSAATEAGIEDAEWSPVFDVPVLTYVSIDYISDQYLQFRATLTSTVRGLSPTLSIVTIRNMTTTSTHFFTTNFILPSRPVKGLLTANTVVPVSADVVFGITTKDSVNFADYQIIENNRIFTTASDQIDNNLRVGVKFLSASLPGLSEEPYDEYSGTGFSGPRYSCSIPFTFTNATGSTQEFNYRIKFYSNEYKTADSLTYTFFSGNDQYGWTADGSAFPAPALTIANGATSAIEFTPAEEVEVDQRWYVEIDAYCDSGWINVTPLGSYACESCYARYEHGLVAQYYQTGIGFQQYIPNFNAYNPDYTLYDTHIDFNPGSSPWVTTGGVSLGPTWNELFAARWKGLLYVPETGVYTFAVRSDDGSRLYIDSEAVVNNDGVHGVWKVTSSQITLTEGYHKIDLHYFVAYAPNALQLYWTRPGYAEAIIAPDYLYHLEVSEYCTAEVPVLKNFALLIQLEGGEKIKINMQQNL